MRLAIAFLLLMTAGALGQYQAPPVHHSYSEGSRLAIATNQPMVLWVGCKPPYNLYTVVTATTLVLEGYPAQCVVVSVPKDGVMYWKATLPMHATSQQVLDALAAKAVQPLAAPFRSVFAQQSAFDCWNSGG